MFPFTFPAAREARILRGPPVRPLPGRRAGIPPHP